MQSASRLFSPEDHRLVTAAIVSAEQKTAAEICPVIVGASGRYDRAEDLVGLWVALLTFCYLWFRWPPLPADPQTWGEPSPALQFAGYCVAMLVAFILGTLVASRVRLLRRLCTPAAQMRDEVRQRAQALFFDQRVHHTAGASGILIYISLYEEQAAILADHHVLAKVGQETLDAWRNDLTVQLRRRGIIPALCHVIERSGDKLGAVMPRQTDDRNELSDALVVLE